MTRARAQLQQAGTPGQAAEANNMLTQTLRSLFAVAEAYPDLKANQNFLELQRELTDTEDKIAYARQFYNTNVAQLQREDADVPERHLREHVRLQAGRVLRGRGRGARRTSRSASPRRRLQHRRRRRLRRWPKAPTRSVRRLGQPVLDLRPHRHEQARDVAHDAAFRRRARRLRDRDRARARLPPWPALVVRLRWPRRIVRAVQLLRQRRRRPRRQQRARSDERAGAGATYNVVENLCIGSGLPMPKVYVIEDCAPNAFATGRDPEARRRHGHARAAQQARQVGARGRDRARDVPHRQLRHPRHDDHGCAGRARRAARRSLHAVDVVRRRRAHAATATAAATPRHHSLRSRDRCSPSSRRSPPSSSSSPISRQREYLADASGALLCRNPDALARALEKISADPEPLEEANKATAHLYFANPLHDHESSSTACSAPTRPSRSGSASSAPCKPCNKAPVFRASRRHRQFRPIQHLTSTSSLQLGTARPNVL